MAYRPLTFEEWQAAEYGAPTPPPPAPVSGGVVYEAPPPQAAPPPQQAAPPAATYQTDASTSGGNYAPTPAPQPAAPAPAPVPSEVYGGPSTEPALSTPRVVQTSYPATGAPPSSRTVPPPQIITSGNYQGMTPTQANAAYQEARPPWTVPFALANEQANAERAARDLQQQYAETEIPARRENLRALDQVSSQGIYDTGPTRPVQPQYQPNQITGNAALSPAETAYERQLTERARTELMNPEGQQWGAAVVAPLGQAKDAAGNLLPDQLDAVAGAAGAVGGAITSRLGASDQATQRLAAEQAQPAPGMPGFGDLAGSTVRGGISGLQAESDPLRKPAAALLGAVSGASKPQMQVTEVLGQRAYDRIQGDENATYGDDAMTGFYEDLVGAGFSPIAFGRFTDDPANAPLIEQVYEQGYKGYTGGQAIYQFYRDQQGLGGVVTDIAHDPLAPLEIGLAVGTAGVGGLAAGAGRVIGKEAAGMTARNVIRGTGRVATAVAVDPFDAGPVVRDAAKIIAPGAAGRVGAKATDIYRDVVLTESGRREVVGREVNTAAQRLAQSANEGTAAAPAPILFERTAPNGPPVTAPDPVSGAPRPVIRDPLTGTPRPVTEADFDLAMQTMARLPENQFRTMRDDWFGLGMDAANRQAAGMGRTVEKFYPRHGPEYERYVATYAMRARTRGQSVVDSMWQEAATDFPAAVANLKRIQRAKPVNPVALRAAQDEVTRVAYQSHMIDAVTSIAGITDRSAKQHRTMATKWRRTAEALPGYGGRVERQAMLASGAKILDPTSTQLLPGRTINWDELTTLDDDTRALLSEKVSGGKDLGQVALDVQADLRRIKELADSTATRQAQGLPLSAGDEKQLQTLLAEYRHLFPGEKGIVFNPKDPAMAQQALDAARAWDDEAIYTHTGLEVEERYGVEKKWRTKTSRKPTETGTDWADKTGPLGPKVSGAIRGLDAVSRGTGKWLLHNPARAPGFAMLQLFGNAVGQFISKPAALFHFMRPTQWVKGYRKLQGDVGALTNYNKYAAASGMRPSSRVQNALDPQRYGKMTGIGQGYFNKAKHAAGTFDLGNAESAFMETVLVEERRLQRWMRLPSGNRLDGFSAADRQTPIATARRMGIPATRVSDEAITAALDAARTDKWHGILTPQDVKTALYEAAAVRPGADPAIDTWVDRVGRDYTNLRKRIDDAGLAEKDRVAFSWNETKADAVLSRMFLFHYWNSRASVLYARNLLGSPAMLNGYVSLMRTLEQESESGNYPSWLGGFARFMTTPAGIGVFLNPTATFNTMLTFRSEAMKGEDDFFQRLTPLGAARENSPFMVHPIWDNLFFISGMAGADARPSQLLPTAALNREIYNLLNLANIETKGKILGTTDGTPTLIDARLRNVAGSEMTKSLAEWFQTKVVDLDDPVRAGDPNASTNSNIYYLMVQQQLDKGHTLEEAQQIVYDLGGQFNPDTPEYQQAIADLAEAPFLGPGLGLDPASLPGQIVGALSTRLGPFPAQTDVTLRSQLGNTVGQYFEMEEAAPTYEAILDGETAEPLRVGGYRLQIPGTFSATEAGGTVYTPEDIAAMTPEQRQALADQWLAGTVGATDLNAGFPETELGVMGDASAASPEDAALQRAEDAFYNPGTPEQNLIAKTANGLRYGTLPEGVTEVSFTIDGQTQTYDQADLANMTDGERKALRGLWLSQEGRQAEYDGYYAAKQALVAEHPDLGGMAAMDDLARDYPGGPVAWAEAAVKENPETYGEFAARLDPTRYPPGTEEWAKKMLSLEGYQALNQQRPTASSPLAWEKTPGAPVIPGLTGASTLNDAYATQQAESANTDEYKSRGDVVVADFDRMLRMQQTVNDWDAANGLPVGTSWGKVVHQMTNGYQKGVNTLDPALYDVLEADYSVQGEDGKTYGPIPGPESYQGQFTVWALRQADPSVADPQQWAREAIFKEEMAKAGEQGITVDPTGTTVLAEETAGSVLPGSLLAGYGMTRAVDGSGESLGTQTATAPAPSANWRVGNLGATLYQEAATSSQPLIALDPSMPLTVVADGPDWVQVETPFGMQGFVRKRYMATDSAPAPGALSGTPQGTYRGAADLAAPVPTAPASPLRASIAPAPVTTTPAVKTASVWRDPAGQSVPLVTADGAPVTPNYGYPGENPDGTRTAPPQFVVYHYTVGDMETFMGEFMGATQRASSNYVVDRDGTIYTVVPPDYSAWANGDTDMALPPGADPSLNFNQQSVSIEIVNDGCANGADPSTCQPYTPEQYAALESLTAQLTRQYGIPANNLIGHQDVTSHKSDPGPLFDWARIRAAASR